MCAPLVIGLRHLDALSLRRLGEELARSPSKSAELVSGGFIGHEAAQMTSGIDSQREPAPLPPTSQPASGLSF